MIGLICKYYKRIDIYKPLTSRPANSERYLIIYIIKRLGELWKKWLLRELNRFGLELDE
jgi:hypothetical protein